MSAGDRQVNSQTGVIQAIWQTSVEVKRQTGEVIEQYARDRYADRSNEKGGQTGVYSTGKLPDK